MIENICNNVFGIIFYNFELIKLISPGHARTSFYLLFTHDFKNSGSVPDYQNKTKNLDWKFPHNSMPIFTNFAITHEKNSAWGFVNNAKREILDISHYKKLAYQKNKGSTIIIKDPQEEKTQPTCQVQNQRHLEKLVNASKETPNVKNTFCRKRKMCQVRRLLNPRSKFIGV